MRSGASSALAASSAALLALLASCACNTPAAPPTAPAGAAPAAPPPAAPHAFEENGGAACAAPALPPLEQLPPQPSLPDPFLSSTGQRIATRAEWACRRAEIAAQVQEYELGPKPPKPSVVTGALSGDQLTITAGEPGHTVSFSVGIARPAASAATTTPNAPVPALIVIGGRSSLSPVFAGRGVAVISFDNNAMGAQGNKQEGDVYTNTRGQGTFYELYGKDHPASSMMAWAWGVSRVIDALAATPEAGIDVKHLAVSGCSRNGKGALVVGAFDERIALTVPQESGAGGTASWRISQAQMDNYRATVAPNPPGGKGVQTLLQASGEQPWFRASFAQFGKSTSDVNRLPFDQHMVLGLVAPRALFVLDNTDMQWLGDDSSFTNAVAAAEIWNGLGAQGSMGASQAGGHPHCTDVPQPQLDELGAFIDKFLLGVTDTDTMVLHSDRIKPDRARWVTWSTPALK
jgi:(4-O-methyl)-D-glucuronate---lignin esterase